MKQEEASERLKNILCDKSIDYQSESIKFRLKGKYNNSQIYLFTFIEVDGTIRAAVIGEFDVIITEYSYQYIEGSLGIGVSKEKAQNLHKSIINFSIGKYIVTQNGNREYEKVNDIDFARIAPDFLYNDKGMYEFFTANCIVGKNELQYYGVNGFTIKSNDVIIEAVSNVKSLQIETDTYAIVGTFTVNSQYKADLFYPQTTISVSQEYNICNKHLFYTLHPT